MTGSVHRVHFSKPLDSIKKAIMMSLSKIDVGTNTFICKSFVEHHVHRFFIRKKISKNGVVRQIAVSINRSYW